RAPRSPPARPSQLMGVTQRSSEHGRARFGRAGTRWCGPLAASADARRLTSVHRGARCAVSHLRCPRTQPPQPRVSPVLVLVVAVGACFVAPATSTHAAVPICDQLGALVPPSVPAALAAPSGTTLAKRVLAEGVQIYTCTRPTGGGATVAYTWTLKAPD